MHNIYQNGHKVRLGNMFSRIKKKTKKTKQQDRLYSILTVFDIVIFFFWIYMLEKIVMQQHCCHEYPLAGTFAFKTMWSD